MQRRLAAFIVLAQCAAADAAAQAPAIEDLIALRDIGGYRSGLALSPDGTEAAFFERQADLDGNDYVHRLVVVPLDGGPARVLASAGGVIVLAPGGRPTGAPADRVPAWSPDGRWLAFLARVGDHVELWRVAADGSGGERVVETAGDVARFAWLDNDQLVFETLTPRASLTAADAQRRAHGFRPDERFEPYHSLTPFADVMAGRSVSIVRLADRTLRGASAEDERALAPAPGRFGPEGAVAFDAEHDQRAWISPLVAGDAASSPRLALSVTQHGKVRRCAHQACSGRMTGAWIVGSEIVFHRLEGHGDSDAALYAWRPGADALRLVRRGDEALYGCDDAEAVLVCFQESPLQPRRLVAIDLATGALRVLYDPNPSWRNFRLTRVERLFVHDFHGNEGYAHLVYPAGYRSGRRYPLVIVQYRSRGFLRGGVGGEYPIHVLAGRGYFVLSVDRVEWRALETELSASALQIRTELDGSEQLMKQSQIESLLEIVERESLVDPRRIGITGLSDGAETVYWMITRTDRFAAAVTSTPPTDPTAWTLGAERFRRSLRETGMTGPWPETEGPWRRWWDDNAIVRHADRIRTPLLMNLSDGEAQLGFPLYVRLSELDRPVEIYLYPDAHHVKWRPLQLIAAQRRALDWLDFWLLGLERPDPFEPQRLERWRALQTMVRATPAHH